MPNRKNNELNWIVMNCSISSKHVKATWHILLCFSVTVTWISSNFKIMQTERRKWYIFYKLTECLIFTYFTNHCALQLYPTKQLCFISCHYFTGENKFLSRRPNFWVRNLTRTPDRVRKKWVLQTKCTSARDTTRNIASYTL